MATWKKVVIGVFVFCAIGSVVEQSLKKPKDNTANEQAAARLIEAGVFTKGGNGEVWTGPMWAGLSFDDK